MSEFKTSNAFQRFKDELREGGRSITCDWQAINDNGFAVEGWTIYPEHAKIVVLHLVTGQGDHKSDMGFEIFIDEHTLAENVRNFVGENTKIP